MQHYWVTFTDGTNAGCDGQSDYDVKIIAEKLTGKTVAGGQYKDITVKSLPYPCSKMIWSFEHPVHGKTPGFCHSPKQCAGRTSCPQSYACSE